MEIRKSGNAKDTFGYSISLEKISQYIHCNQEHAFTHFHLQITILIFIITISYFLQKYANLATRQPLSATSGYLSASKKSPQDLLF